MLRRAAFVTPFVGLIWAFHFFDPYRTLFFGGPRLELLAYNAGRLAVAAYFAVIIFGLGRLVFIVFKRLDAACVGLDAFEEFAMTALVGSSVLRIGMLPLGLLGGYSTWTALAIAIVALLAAYSRLAQLFAIAAKALARDGQDPAERVARSMAAGSIVLAVIVVILFKVLFPNGTGAYFTHYFPYYMEVTEKGNILPNMLWYHFFYLQRGRRYFLCGLARRRFESSQRFAPHVPAEFGVHLVVYSTDDRRHTRWPFWHRGVGVGVHLDI
jgi:hypothetical protein